MKTNSGTCSVKTHLKHYEENDMRLFILLMFMPLYAWAEYIDFTNAILLGKGICEIEKQTLPCALVEQDNKQYLVVFDRKGEAQQWQIEKNGKATLLWSRDSI